MKYLMIAYGAENAWSDESRQKCMQDTMQICEELASERKLVAVSPLEPVQTAATARFRDGEILITDGPFAETTEQLGGYFLVEMRDLDEAIELASRLPPATKGTVEIRPVRGLNDLPPSRSLAERSNETNGRPFMLLCYDNETSWRDAGPEAMEKALAEAARLARRLDNSSRYLAASPLHPTSTATCVRVRDGRRQITDGPFAETHEVFGGFYLIVAQSREEALDVAAQHCTISRGAIEVRPVVDLPELRRFPVNL